MSGIKAAERAIGQFRVLLKRSHVMSEDSMVGLWGEMWALIRLLNKYGTGTIDSWKGPDKGVHDFRIGNNELEIKTTRNEERTHIISRLSQLEPSPDMDLYLVSAAGSVNRSVIRSQPPGSYSVQ